MHHIVLYEDYMNHEEEVVLKKALAYDIKMLAHDYKQKKRKNEKNPKPAAKKVNSIEFKTHGK